MKYTLHPECIICTEVLSSVRNEIDAKILMDVPDTDILEEFKLQFPPSSPLTLDAIAHHRQHLFKSLALQKLESVGIAPGSIKILSAEEQDKSLMETYQNIQKGNIQELQILNSLIIDAYRDTVILNQHIASNASNPNQRRLMILTKDTVRKNLMDTLQRQTEIRQKEGDLELEKRNFARTIISEVLTTLVQVLQEDLKFSNDSVANVGESLKFRLSQNTIIKQYL